MMIDDEKFFAWLDGELTGAEAAEVESRVAADARLQRMAEQHRAFGARVRGAFDTVAAQDVPERLRAAVAPRSKVVDFGAWRPRRREGGWAPIPQWAAMAATLVLGIGLGTMVGGGGAIESPVELRDGRMYAASYLDDALDTQLASAGGGDRVRIGITFRDETGAVCRSFADAQSSGLACRDRGDWHLRGLFAAPEGQEGEYRMAAGVDPNLAALIDSTLAGDAFDAEQEEQARDSGWR
ncbi:MAG TPA: anti-sigma factor [Sphingomicrobium sp.]|nr:anti-sigma factor [Sphingomicrobium sp.]